jgi:hypothetical protein
MLIYLASHTADQARLAVGIPGLYTSAGWYALPLAAAYRDDLIGIQPCRAWCPPADQRLLSVFGAGVSAGESDDDVCAVGQSMRTAHPSVPPAGAVSDGGLSGTARTGMVIPW